MTIIKLADIGYVGSSPAAVYTNPSSTTTYLKGLLLFNGNTTAETVKVYVVPNSGASAGTAGAANQVAELSLAAKETITLSLSADGVPVVLDGTNDTLQASTTTSSKVTVIPLGATE